MRKPPTRWRQHKADIGLQRLVAIAKTSGDVAPTATAIGTTFARGRAPTAILVVRYTAPTAPMAGYVIGVAIPTAAGATIAEARVGFSDMI